MCLTKMRLVIGRAIKSDSGPYQFDDPSTSQIFDIEQHLAPNIPTIEEGQETPPKKTRSLREIYELHELGLFSCEPHLLKKF